MLLRQLTANSSSPGLTGLKAHQARTDACTARVRVLHHKAVALTVALGLLTAGCGINESTYERAPLPEVASFPQAQHYLGPQIAAEFWRGFGDPLLDACIAKALTANYDIRTAAVRVEQALLNLDISRTDRHPTASAQVELSGRRSLSEGEAVQKSSSSSFAVSYEADVFGKVSAANRSALENYRATAYDYWAMRLTVIDAVATAYWQFAYCQDAVHLGISDLQASARRVKLVSEQYNEGAVSNVELDKARIDHMQVQETLDGRFNELHKAHNALNTLLGQTADEQPEVGSLDSARLPEFPLDLPADLLARRPDLMEQEARIREALADYDSARAAFFPSFTLSAGIAAGDGGSLYRFLRDPVGTLAGAVTLPFLNYNRLSLERESALKAKDLAELQFAEAYIKAVAEVFDSVSDIDYYRRNLKNTRARYDLSKRNYQGYLHRYAEGSSPLSDLLDASDSLRNAEITHLATKRNLLQTTMGLMIALGGDTVQVMKVN